MHTTKVRVVRVAVVVALAVAGYFLFVRAPHLDRRLIKNLVLTHTAVSGLHHSRTILSESVPPSSSTFSVVRKAAKEHPDATGLYETEWYLSSSAPPEVGILMQVLPDDSEAKTALLDSDDEQVKTPSIQNKTASNPEAFAIPGVPGAQGVAYSLTGSGKHDGYIYEDAFRFGRVVVSELADTSDAALNPSALVDDARSEHSLLERAEPGFTMAPDNSPLVASVVYAAVALVVAAAAYFGPEWAIAAAARRRVRHEERERERIRSQYRARGRRAVRRHRAPAWRQTSRR